MTKRQVIDQLARRAIRMKVGGFRPVDNPLASWIGNVLVASAEEGWPHASGKPMLPLCQVNLDEFPFKPEPVSDVALITIFISADELPYSEDTNGTSWCLRAYQTTDALVPLAQVKRSSPIKPMQMLPEIIDQDFPCYDDCPLQLPATFDDDYSQLFPNADGIKFGGWPTLVQGEISWAANNPQFAFQIDSVQKARWQWGDNGVGYFGRNTIQTGADRWTFAWQSY
ncbi:DUF1963 domain-containing protein [Spirosoma areae]